MALLRITSPHTHTNRSTADVMRLVALATLPGVLALTWFFGWGTLINLVWASLLAVGFEALCIKLRRRNISFYLKDYSAVVTAVLLALAIPPYAPWWLTLVGISFAIIIAKQLYGGLGFNPFNPAMIGYVVLLISFPIEMTSWPISSDLHSGSSPNLLEAITIIFPFLSDTLPDAITSATPLDLMKQHGDQTIETLYLAERTFSESLIAGSGYEWVNIGFLLGGLLLLQQGIFTWHAPVAFLIALSICAGLFNDGGSAASEGPVLFHLFSGGTMLGAFFIITDPVTSPTTIKGKIYFGACTGILVFIIRAWGNYPDAIAFAVLLMNLCAPTIEYYTLPRTYGHQRTRRATEKEE